MKIQKNNHETNDIIKSDAAALTIGQKNFLRRQKPYCCKNCTYFGAGFCCLRPL